MPPSQKLRGQPLRQEVAARGDRDHDPGPRVRSHLPPHVLAECLRPALRQIAKKLAAPPEERTQEAWHGQHDVTVGDGLEHLFAQPFGPEEGALLLAGGAERSAATRVRDQVAQATRLAPSACKAMGHVPALDEPAEHALDDRTQGAVLFGEALGVHAEERVDVLLD
jgi:hypothetical protein